MKYLYQFWQFWPIFTSWRLPACILSGVWKDVERLGMIQIFTHLHKMASKCHCVFAVVTFVCTCVYFAILAEMEFIEKNVKLNELRTGIPMSTKALFVPLFGTLSVIKGECFTHVARQLLASPAMSWLMPCARDPSRLGPAGSLEMYWDGCARVSSDSCNQLLNQDRLSLEHTLTIIDSYWCGRNRDWPSMTDWEWRNEK